MSGPSGQHGPHVFVADLEQPELHEDDRHHVERSLRLRAGDPLTISDGAGRWRRCSFGSTIEPVGDIERVPPPSPLLAVGFAVVKGSRPELVVQKLTELGIDRIIPLQTDHSVVRWDDRRANANRERFDRIAREAAMQSRRVWRPHIEQVQPLRALLTGEVALAHPGGRELTSHDRTVLVGPEGGWSSQEVAGQDTIGLGDTILRAETAAIAVGVLMAARRREATA